MPPPHPSSMQGGLYVFQIYDHFSCSGASLLLLSIFQSVAVGWIYGTNSSYLSPPSSPVIPHPFCLIIGFCKTNKRQLDCVQCLYIKNE